MEQLKKFEEICQKDVRQDFFKMMDANHPGILRPRKLEDDYRIAESIQLHEGVPEKIRDHFQTARNLIIYSWFYYPFNVTAELCAFATVEYALKIRKGKTKAKPTFSELMKKAVAEGWISDEGFSVAKRRKERAREYNEGMPLEFQMREPATVREYCDVLAKNIPKLRNELAHGSSTLHNHGAGHVRICAELINQLFPAPKAD